MFWSYQVKKYCAWKMFGGIDLYVCISKASINSLIPSHVFKVKEVKTIENNKHNEVAQVRPLVKSKLL